MIFKFDVCPELWNRVESDYVAERYGVASNLVLKVVSEKICALSGLDGDGLDLVEAAFGGKDPIVRVNDFFTDEDLLVQKGFIDVLTGLFTLVKNDGIYDVNVVIVLADHILKCLDKCKVRFSVDDFLERIFDESYVCSDKYSELLVKEIPFGCRADVAIKVLLLKDRGDIFKLGSFFRQLLKGMAEVDVVRVCKFVSDILKVTNDEREIRYMLYLVPGKYWKRMDEISRIRIENLLFENFRKASYDVQKQCCGEFGALATWVTKGHLVAFNEIDKWTSQAIHMYYSGLQKSYVQKFFMNTIIDVNRNHICPAFKSFLKDGLERNDPDVVHIIKRQIECDANHPWWNVLKDELENRSDIMLLDLNEVLSVD